MAEGEDFILQPISKGCIVLYPVLINRSITLNKYEVKSVGKEYCMLDDGTFKGGFKAANDEMLVVEYN